MSAFLFEEALKKNGFEEALKMVYSNNDGARFFENLNQVLDVNEKNFHKTIVRLITEK